MGNNHPMWQVRGGMAPPSQSGEGVAGEILRDGVFAAAGDGTGDGSGDGADGNGAGDGADGDGVFAAAGTIEELNGGMFGLTLPPFLVLFLSIILIGVGSFYFLQGGILAIVVGFVVLAVGSKSPLEKKLELIRQRLRGGELALAQEEVGIELLSFWNTSTVERRGSGDRDWIFPPPPKSEWGSNPYSADKSAQLIAEHPNKIGTPKPPTISNYGLFSSLAFATAAGAALLASSEPNFESAISLSMILVVVSTVWLFASAFIWKKGEAMQDTPTSNIRSMAVGAVELVGQARPWVEPPPTVIVDHDPSKSVDNLNAWSWSYEVYRCRKVTTTDSKGRRTTRTVCSWEPVRSDAGGHPFLVHDGTGGVLTHPHTFSRQDLGPRLARWECAHSLQARDLLWRLATSGDVRRHRWTLWGLRMLDPCYVMGDAQSRKKESLEREKSVDKTIQNSLLEVVGEDSPGFKARLVKGTELTNLDDMKSQFELLVIPTLALFSSFLLI